MTLETKFDREASLAHSQPSRSALSSESGGFADRFAPEVLGKSVILL
jgi:hypothetical protein